jgi:uncharacterized protein YqjF (DUF2071 family)
MTDATTLAGIGKPDRGTACAPGSLAAIEGDGGAVLRAAWERLAFLHYEVDPDALQRSTPFRVDLHEGRAYVSLVAFTQRGLRPIRFGRLGAWAAAPVATHPFLNVRTYVVEGGEPGIQFLAEWIPNPFALLLGPLLYGLPYRRGRLAYRHDAERRQVEGSVRALDAGARLEPESLDAFLLERYAAFGLRRGRPTRFRVAHPPWRAVRVGARVRDEGLLAAAGPWAATARFAGAHYAPGLPDVLLGRPMALRGRETAGRPAGTTGG